LKSYKKSIETKCTEGNLPKKTVEQIQKQFDSIELRMTDKSLARVALNRKIKEL